MDIRPPTPDELESIEATRRAYRAMWATLQRVPHHAFDGSRNDLDALDFIEYEAGHHPEGLTGAAIIWGGVLAGSGVLSWAIGDERHFVLVGDPVYPRTMIFPYARVIEIQNSTVPQYSKYEWLLEEAVFRLLSSGFMDEEAARLTALLSPDAEGFLAFARGNVEWLESQGKMPPRVKRY